MDEPCYYEDDYDCRNWKRCFVCPHCALKICYACIEDSKCTMVVCDAPEDHKDYGKEVPQCPRCLDSVGTWAHMEYYCNYSKYLNAVENC